MPPVTYPPHYTRCRSCGARIFYAVTPKKRKLIPVDAEPTDHGNLVVDLPTEPGDQPVVIAVSGAQLPPPRWTSHFATCPEPDRWRKKS